MSPPLHHWFSCKIQNTEKVLNFVAEVVRLSELFLNTSTSLLSLGEAGALLLEEARPPSLLVSFIWNFHDR
jgi:hypothetical protein